MSEQIVQLEAGDFEEAMSFLDLVFGEHRPHDFRNMLPSVYQPTDEHMRCNYAVRTGGHIAAIVGLFPIDLCVKDARLKVAGIGGVSVHPDFRGQGLMKLLMDRVLDECKTQGYQLSYLSGRRQRYQYWGWERGGCELLFDVDTDNIRHAFAGMDEPALTLEPVEGDISHNVALKAIHNRQLIRCERPVNRFHHYLRSWHSHPFVARDSSGAVVGYLCQTGDREKVFEFAADNDNIAFDMIRQFVMTQDKSIAFMTTAMPTPIARRLAAFAGSMTVRESGNWQVFDWSTTVDAILKVRHGVEPLPDGSVMLGIDHSDVVFRMSVDGCDATCTPADQQPDLTTDAATMLRVLFGPLPPTQVMPIPPGAAILHAWCPLPLGFSVQDYV